MRWSRPRGGTSLHPTDEDLLFGKRYHDLYSKKEGSNQIASEVALAYLSACLRIHRPRVVLECGAGIGTITDAVLSHDCGVEKLFSIEDNEFCLHALGENLAHHDSSRVSIVTRPESLAGLEVDMVIGDGGWESAAEYAAITAGTVVFVEGVRRRFREGLIRFLSSQDPPHSIDLKEYGATTRYRLEFAARLPLPIRLRRVRTRMGCWIGESIGGHGAHGSRRSSTRSSSR